MSFPQSVPESTSSPRTSKLEFHSASVNWAPDIRPPTLDTAFTPDVRVYKYKKQQLKHSISIYKKWQQKKVIKTVKCQSKSNMLSKSNVWQFHFDSRKEPLRESTKISELFITRKLFAKNLPACADPLREVLALLSVCQILHKKIYCMSKK